MTRPVSNAYDIQVILLFFVLMINIDNSLRLILGRLKCYRPLFLNLAFDNSDNFSLSRPKLD